MTIKDTNHLWMVSYLAFQGNPLLTISQDGLWMPKVDTFGRSFFIGFRGFNFFFRKWRDFKSHAKHFLSRGFLVLQPTV
jgi:hypothetical protein